MPSPGKKLNILNYSFRRRFFIKISMMFMPYVGYLFFSDRINTLIWRMLGVKVGACSIIRRGTYINDPCNITIGKRSVVHGKIRSRGGVIIGDNVEFVGDISLSTQKHNVSSSLFENLYEPVVIENEAWISLNAVILGGVVVGEGAVIAAGAIVTKNCAPWGVFGGVPAKCIGARAKIDRLTVDAMRDGGVL
ncbi:acyltransferase [Teredinibacter turnerae]|uniref:acyltransferase n=1 Tax=Teredinibacter turnerae TaxID=2426 RepID=UPI0003779E75|nr:hypothetical protein [Teredinibacter turnerae]